MDNENELIQDNIYIFSKKDYLKFLYILIPIVVTCLFFVGEKDGVWYILFFWALFFIPISFIFFIRGVVSSIRFKKVEYFFSNFKVFMLIFITSLIIIFIANSVGINPFECMYGGCN